MADIFKEWENWALKLYLVMLSASQSPWLGFLSECLDPVIPVRKFSLVFENELLYIQELPLHSVVVYLHSWQQVVQM